MLRDVAPQRPALVEFSDPITPTGDNSPDYREAGSDVAIRSPEITSGETINLGPLASRPVAYCTYGIFPFRREAFTLMMPCDSPSRSHTFSPSVQFTS
jgi:hypothetical protein